MDPPIYVLHYFSCVSGTGPTLRAGPWQGQRLFSLSKPALGPTESPNQWVDGLKRQRREADHSPSSDA
jgi:hypothetical protein